MQDKKSGGHGRLRPGVRLRRAGLGMNAVLAVVLAGMVLVLSNVLMQAFPVRLNLEAADRYVLSEQSKRMLEGLSAQVRVVAFFESNSRFATDVTHLLREYAHAASRIPALTLEVEFLDPDRDIARTRELARHYELTEPNVVVFESGGRRSYVTADALGRFEHEMTGPGRIMRRYIGFTGEQVFSSAILSVTESRAPVAYFLQGHGERDTAAVNPAGYSGVVRELKRQNVDVRPLNLPAAGQVPDDCAVLAIAGPTHRIAEAEVAMIGDYLRRRNGRLLLLADPRVSTGLDPLLAEWGVELGQGVVYGMSLTGGELVVTAYGEHAVTRPFNAVMTAFYNPRAVYPAGGRDRRAQADRAQVTVLAMTGMEGWEQLDPEQDPPRYDEGQDNPGPVPVAVAVERGLPSADIRSTRLIVIGDSAFVSNGALRQGVGGNLSFFMCAFNWLAERDALIEVAPRSPYVLQPGLTRAQWSRLLLLQVGTVPGALLVLAGLVRLKRRR